MFALTNTLLLVIYINFVMLTPFLGFIVKIINNLKIKGFAMSLTVLQQNGFQLTVQAREGNFPLYLSRWFLL